MYLERISKQLLQENIRQQHDEDTQLIRRQLDNNGDEYVRERAYSKQHIRRKFRWIIRTSPAIESLFSYQIWKTEESHWSITDETFLMLSKNPQPNTLSIFDRSESRTIFRATFEYLAIRICQS